MNNTQKQIPFRAQSESFTSLLDDNCYYIDKTEFIRYLIEHGDKICVFTRPRRFGKTLMLRTLRTFFEYRYDSEGNLVDNRHYFEGLNVMKSGEHVLKHMGQHPVISLSLKNMRNDTIEDMMMKLRNALATACNEHAYLLKHPALQAFEHDQFRQILSKEIKSSDLEEALGNICSWLFKATGRKSVILLDEYDVPLQQAAIYDNHYPGSGLFEKTVRLIGNFISSGFKSNDNLAFGIISGCMRVAKESVFTGMNNPGVITVLDNIPEEFWGFTQPEVEKMLDYYGLSDQMDALKNWYDGYYYSNREVYNPWSLLNAIRGLVDGYGDDAIQPYWAMTSSNDIIDDMIVQNPQYREELARLMQGQTKWVPVYKDLSYRDLKTRPDAIWSFLLYTGYLKSLKIKKNDDDLWEAEVTVPNREIITVMKSAMRHWWNDIQLPAHNTQTILSALVSGDIKTIEQEIRLVLSDSTSVFDYNEAFYHGMLLGWLNPSATVRSNDEYGEGRPDLVVLSNDKGIIIEVKCVTPGALRQFQKSHPTLDEFDAIDACVATQLEKAEKQIHDQKYARAVLRNEPTAREVIAYAICFCKKWCAVKRVKL